MKSSAVYYIDAEYRVLGFNDVCAQRFPQLKKGEFCYQCLQHKEEPCSVCPVKNNVRGPKNFVDPIRGIFESIEAAELPLPDGTMGHSIILNFPEESSGQLSGTAEELHWMNVIQALGDSYSLIFNLDCGTGLCKTYQVNTELPEKVKAILRGSSSYRELLKELTDTLVLPEDKSKLAMVSDLSAVQEELKLRPGFTIHYRVMGEKYVHFYSIRFARIGDAEGFNEVLIAISCEDGDRKIAAAEGFVPSREHSLRRKILVVEDNLLNREMLVQILTPEYEVLCAENGEEGIKLLSENYRKLSLVVLDVYMPVCNGFQFLARTRSDPLLAAVPVIVATGSDRPEDEARCLELGAMDFITKPYNIRGVQGRIRNLIKMRESAAMLTEIEFDGQTGLYTRQAFFHHASVLLNTDPAGTYQIVLVDIDNFKQINSIYGESVGDDVIRFLAGELKRLVPSGLVAHYEGDNFVFMEQVGRTLPELEEMMNDISKRSPVRRIRYKCGVCLCDDETMPVSVLCNRAFLALNSIKEDMSKLAASFDDPINQKLCRERDMESGFEDALQNQEFVIWYQPKYDVHSERMVGAEALVRWKKPDGALVPPGEFISLFERDGLIVKLDEYVFRKVCQTQKSLFLKMGRTMPISVNLSRSSLHYPGMIDRYACIVREYQLDAQMVPIELTESSGAGMNQIKDLAQKMVALGFPLHMDDFGCGYSSLGNLNSLPFHMLKLDKSLIDYIGNPRGDQVLRHVIALAHGLGMEVLAEGVETAEQLQFLREVSCDVIQGYYFSKPLPEDKFLEMVSKWNETLEAPGLQIRHALSL